MKDNYFTNQIKELQNNYCDILRTASTEFSTQDLPMIIDEINIFWFANRDLVRLILNNISFNYDCYTFTGASFLDIDDYEHFPFVTLGRTHIVDDPLYKYVNITSEIPNNDFHEKLQEQMLLTMKDNIKIIEEYSDAIYILPVTLLSDVKTDLIKNASEQAFFSMFKDNINDLEQYTNSCKSIEDVEKVLKEGVSRIIIFSDKNDGNDLISRFQNFKAQPHPFSDGTTDAMIFFYIVIGFFMQALSILLMCAEYRMIPYLRYEALYRFTILLGGNFKENTEMQMILFKSICAHLLYNVFDKRRVKATDFIQYISILKKENFSNNIFETLQKNGIDINNPSFESIANILREELDKIYVDLNPVND